MVLPWHGIEVIIYLVNCKTKHQSMCPSAFRQHFLNYQTLFGELVSHHLASSSRTRSFSLSKAGVLGANLILAFVSHLPVFKERRAFVCTCGGWFTNNDATRPIKTPGRPCAVLCLSDKCSLLCARNAHCTTGHVSQPVSERACHDIRRPSRTLSCCQRGCDLIRWPGPRL